MKSKFKEGDIISALYDSSTNIYSKYIKGRYYKVLAVKTNEYEHRVSTICLLTGRKNGWGEINFNKVENLSKLEKELYGV